MTAITDAISALSIQRDTDFAQQTPIIFSDFQAQANHLTSFTRRIQAPSSMNSTNFSKSKLSSFYSSQPWLDDPLNIAPSKIWTKQPFEYCHSTIEYFFGTVYTRSIQTLMDPSDEHEEFDDQSSHCESRTMLILRPSKWLMRIGLKYGLNVGLSNSSISGWKHTLRTFTLVPDNSPIFELSAAGNILAVKSLLASGNASARDTDSYGRTALHVRHNLEPLFSFLLK